MESSLRYSPRLTLSLNQAVMIVAKTTMATLVKTVM